MARAQQNQYRQEPASRRHVSQGLASQGLGSQGLGSQGLGSQRAATKSGDVWNQLRDELETLLDHVASQQEMSGHESHPNANTSRSGQRAASRHSETEEAPPMRVHSQDRLQSAIDQIRARHARPSGSSPARSQARSVAQPAPRARSNRQDPVYSDDLTDLSEAISRIGRRLERFETTLAEPRQQDRGIEEINTQMEQLTNVVEMLANSVGERGAIKRVENHIAKLADRLGAGRELDVETIDARLDVLSQAFDRLSDLQEQQIEQQAPAQSNEFMRSLSGDVSGIHERLNTMDMDSIEACLRNVYDRLDTFENNQQQSGDGPNPAVEKLSQELAQFTQALDSGNGPITPSLVADRVDALHARIDDIIDVSAPASDLKLDMEALHSTVLNAVEPRFFSLESQIDAIADNFTRAPAADATHYASMDALEKQIQTLADKLEQTGQEFSNLQSLYEEPRAPSSAPDLSALADMVAERTERALASSASTADTKIQSNVLDDFEARMSHLFDNKVANDAPDFSSMEKGIQNVSERLVRLENSLSRANLNATGPDATPPAALVATRPAALPAAAPNLADTSPAETSANASDDTDTPPSSAGRGLTSASIMAQLNNQSARRHRHPGMSDDIESTALDSAKPAIASGSGDAMPRNPTEQAPLNAPAFAPPESEAVRVPVPVGLQADDDEIGPILHQAESELLPEDLAGGSKEKKKSAPKSSFELPDAVAPPAPKSSFENTPAGSRQAATRPEDRAQSSRSTFIAAARRSVQASTQAKQTDADDGSNSLIGRALARFQKSKTTKQSAAETPMAATPSPSSEPAPESSAGAAAAADPSQNAESEVKAGSKQNIASSAEEAKESLLSRHSKPILLAAAVVAVSFLTLNLVNQRLSVPIASNSGVSNASSGELTGSVQIDLPTETSAMEQAAPLTNLANNLPGDLSPGQPEIGTDIVSSIDRIDIAPGVRVIDPTPMANMPAALAPASLNLSEALTPPVIASNLDEALGPLALRQAATNGDARAQFEVASIFAEGRAVAQDLSAAAQWYERAAAQGHAPASYRLGNMYENGSGVGVDLSIASFWYQSAAEAGNRMSMHNLAALSASGAMGEQNFGMAASWFEKAAALGLTDSQFNLGMLHARGLGVPQDLTISYKWFSIAAIGGDEDAAKARDDVARSLNAEVVLGLQNEVNNWSPIALNMSANFAPIGTWDVSFDPGPRIDSQEIVIRVQGALNRLGYDTGIPDGLIGPKTTDAITQFESATGMVPSGEINPRLLAVLGSQPV